MFRLSIYELKQIAERAYNHLKGHSASCNPLALCPWISDDNLFEISCTEASLTHRSSQAIDTAFNSRTQRNDTIEQIS